MNNSRRKNITNIDSAPVPPSNPDPNPNLIFPEPDINQIDSREKTIEGLEDAVKDITEEEKEEEKQKFDDLVKGSSRTLFKTSTIFPLRIFPTEIFIDLNSVVLVNYSFFFSKTIHGIFITNITDVLVFTSAFSATLEIIDSGFTENSIKIRPLPIADAQKARRIIQGLVIVKKQNIDITTFESTPDLVAKLEQLGTSTEFH